MYRIASIGGDGIGPEIISEGKKVLDAAGERFGFEIGWTDFDIGADRYLSSGELLTENDLEGLSEYKAIYFGAIGDERVRPASWKRASSSHSVFILTSMSTSARSDSSKV